MKKLLNTLFITTSGSYVGKKGQTVKVNFEKKELIRIPIHTLEGIICIGRITFSPKAVQLCTENGVCISLLSEYGRFYGRIQGPVSGNVLLRKEQYRKSDNADTTVLIAKAIVTAKILNSRNVLLRAARECEDEMIKSDISNAINRLAQIATDSNSCLTCDQIRGSEGEAAREYFRVFDHLVTAQKDNFFFRGRSRRPPMDNVNALLSFTYTILMHDVASAIESVGLDPAVGYLHSIRPGRQGLALDIMEELRPYLADRLVLSLINRKQVQKGDFLQSASGAVTMSENAKKTLLSMYQKRKREVIRHPFIDEKIEIGLLPYVQSLLMARYIRGDIDGYPPFIWR